MEADRYANGNEGFFIFPSLFHDHDDLDHETLMNTLISV